MAKASPRPSNICSAAPAACGRGGVRSRLDDHGVFLLLDGVTEFAGDVGGGNRQGATFANNAAVFGFKAHVEF